MSVSDDLPIDSLVARYQRAIDAATADLRRNRTDAADARFESLVADTRHLAARAGSLSREELGSLRRESLRLDELIGRVSWLHAGAAQVVQAMLYTALRVQSADVGSLDATASEHLARTVERLIGHLARLSDDNSVLGLAVDALAAGNRQLAAELADRDDQIRSLRRQVDALRVLLEENAPRGRRVPAILLHTAMTISTLLGGAAAVDQLIDDALSSAQEVHLICEAPPHDVDGR